MAARKSSDLIFMISVIEVFPCEFEEGWPVRGVRVSSVVVAVAEISFNVGFVHLGLRVVHHEPFVSEQPVDRRGGFHRQVNPVRVGPQAAVAGIEEHRSWRAERKQRMGVDRAVLDLPGQIPPRDERTAPSEEVAGHPVIFRRLGRVLEVLAPVTPVHLGSEAAGVAREAYPDSVVEGDRVERGLPVARMSGQTDAVGPYAPVGEQVVDQAADSPGPGPYSAPVVRLPPGSLVDKAYEVVGEVLSRIRLESRRAEQAYSPALLREYLPVAVQGHVAEGDDYHQRDGLVGIPGQPQGCGDHGAVPDAWVVADVYLSDYVGLDVVPAVADAGKFKLAEADGGKPLFIGEETVKGLLHVVHDFRPPFIPPFLRRAYLLSVVHGRQGDGRVVAHSPRVPSGEESFRGVVVVVPESEQGPVEVVPVVQIAAVGVPRFDCGGAFRPVRIAFAVREPGQLHAHLAEHLHEVHLPGDVRRGKVRETLLRKAGPCRNAAEGQGQYQASHHNVRLLIPS